MLLKNLISNLKPNFASLKIRGISSDSRNLKKGYLFISVKGNKFDGNKYINHAISKGANVIVHSRSIKKNKKAIFIKVKDPRETLARMSTKYYKKKPKNIIAVTGTNGKTSISHFFHQIFTNQKKRVGFIGTLGFKKNNYLKRRSLTTSDPLSLNKDLEDMKKAEINNVIIEASSHGLKQKRLDFLKIKAGIFTNLSRDHLDYHQNMNNYLNSKLILFNKLLKKESYIITDTDIKEYKILKKIKNKRKLKIYSIGSKSNIIKILKHKIHENFQILEVSYKRKIFKLKINLYGSIQIKNLLMAVLASKICGLKIEKIFKNISMIKSVEGRLELIKILPNKTKIFLDYAHTPAALENAFLSLKEHFNGKLTVIFGCGGDRDKNKRKLMGAIAKKYCDKIYITDDNPRNESASKIRKDIIKGLEHSNMKEIGNRKKAIKFALRNSNANEIILIAGKGHETYQDIGNKRIFLSDKQIIKQFKSSSKYSQKNFNIFKHNSENLRNVLKNKKNLNYNGVSINSKKIQNKNLFIAIKGKVNDGHNFVKEAIKKGASLSVISNNSKKNNKIIKVANTMVFLNQLAKKFRNTSSAKFIGITGSTGKTTVKTMLGTLLKEYSNTYFAPHSYNNHYGVPLSLCNMNLYHKYGVFEIGMSRQKEIYKLSALVKPHIATITNISEAHLENFKNIKGIAKAKSEIIYNIQKDGAIVLNRDDKFFNYFKKIAEKRKIRVISFGYSKKANIQFLNILKDRENFLLKVLIDKKRFDLNISNNNKNFIMNILCCLGILEELNLSFSKIKKFFKYQSFLKGRGKINKVIKFNKKFFLIDESYNANPLSVKSAIENFGNIKKRNKKKYFLFGDMLELGKNSQNYHKRISKFINNSDIDKTFVYGKHSEETYKLLKNRKKGAIVNDLKNFDMKIAKFLQNGDFLMIKGSNATKLHEVSKRLLRAGANAI